MPNLPTGTVTFLFTDIEGSTRLWEQEPGRMGVALAKHDAIVRSAIESNGGTVVKMTGDGAHASFSQPLGAIRAVLALQQALADPAATGGLALRVRCGLHAGVVERRDNDFFGSSVNRAARIMGAAHGGQVLVSHAVAKLVESRLPDGAGWLDLGNVRLRDLADPEHVLQLVHPALQRNFPALRSLEATPNNLPQQITSFVGRERELSKVKALMKDARLLTLLGVGGLGKTRLSLQLAADVMDAFSDGVWLVELAPLADPQLVVQAVASVLGVKDETGRAMQEALVRFVKDRQLLLILDNCEHLLDACAELARSLLQSGPRVKILASSREHLHITGETTYAMPTLAVPQAHERPSVGELVCYEGVRLFVHRAVTAQPAFRVTEENASAVVEICRRLDGIPLAIELAAARVRALSIDKIAERLSDRFRLLTSRDRTALPRQQTLRALIDWSYDLLTGHERVLFQWLSVFAGGFTLEASEALGAGSDVGDVLSLLTNLVEKSLVVLDPESGRYRLLETVRQYGRERLADSGEADSVRARHAAFYLSLAEMAMPELFGPQQGAWLARLDFERENMLAAHAWYDGAADGGALGLRLVHALKPYLMTRGLTGLVQRMTLEALARSGAQERGPARSRALFDAGQTCFFMGQYHEARQLLEEGLAIARELGDDRRVAEILQPLGMAMLGQGDRWAARRHIEEALDLARSLGNKREIAAALNALAQLHRIEGALDSAEPLYKEVVALLRQIGDQESIAIGLLNLAMVFIGRGEGSRTRATLIEAHAITTEIGSKPVGQSVLEVCAGLAAFETDWERTARFFGMAEAHKNLTGLHRDPADEAFLTPHITSARTNLGAAAFSAAEARGRAISYVDAMAEACAWLDGRA